jgi:peptide/nickel transport system ATP-binding protein
VTEPQVSLRGLCVSLPDRSRRRLFRPPPLLDIVRNVDLDIARGSALGLVGESGSGKTTLGRTLVRLIAPTGGSFRYGGSDFEACDVGAMWHLRD